MDSQGLTPEGAALEGSSGLLARQRRPWPLPATEPAAPVVALEASGAIFDRRAVDVRLIVVYVV
jgi:hypothetical protein